MTQNWFKELMIISCKWDIDVETENMNNFARRSSLSNALIL